VFAFIPFFFPAKRKITEFFSRENAKTQKIMSRKGCCSSPVSGEAGRGNKYVCIYSIFLSCKTQNHRIFFSQKRKKSCLAKERRREGILKVGRESR
jgi:hypothetical protein